MVPPRIRLLVLALFTTALFCQAPRPPNRDNPITREDFEAIDANREPFQNATGLLAAMQVSPGDWVADVGAGGGYYSMRLAGLVGPEGKVFAEDIAISSWVSDRARLFDLHNLEIVKGEADDPHLPEGRLAAVLIIDSYHHFTNYRAMLDKILHALKPGGRLAIADYSIAEHRTQARADQLKVHEIDPALARAEVEQAGFRITRLDDPFVKWHAGAGNNRSVPTDLWLMVAVRP